MLTERLLLELQFKCYTKHRKPVVQRLFLRRKIMIQKLDFAEPFFRVSLSNRKTGTRAEYGTL